MRGEEGVCRYPDASALWKKTRDVFPDMFPCFLSRNKIGKSERGVVVGCGSWVLGTVPRGVSARVTGVGVCARGLARFWSPLSVKKGFS